MSKLLELLRDSKDDELWQLCCGFIDLNVDQFMSVQKSLLLEQIGLLNNCALGKRLFRGASPVTVDDFRRNVPLTTYKDYCPDLLERREDVLPAKPVEWIQTMGKSGEYPYKLVPVSQRFWEEAGLNFGAVFLFSSCRHKGEIAIRDKMKILYAASGAPYLTNAVARRIIEDLDCKFLPDLSEAELSGFEERVEKGFNMALSEGMDGFFGLGAILVAIGMKFKERSNQTRKARMLRQPRALFRLSKGMVKSKQAGRRLLPKDLWKLKYIMAMGADSMVYKDRIKDLWGRTPLHVYGNTETTIIATQTWDYKDMVFFPNMNFLEFIPESELANARLTPGYQIKTLLLDQVEARQLYELVITNFHGGTMVRYRTGHLVRITSLKNVALGIELPQMIPEGRADDLIDMQYMRVNERIIWQALEDTGIPYKEWMACKVIEDTPKLHLYLELAGDQHRDPEEMADLIYKAIRQVDGGAYAWDQLPTLDSLIDSHWIKVTVLPKGVFSTFKKIRQAQNADLTQLKPPHLNPSEEDLALLGIRSADFAERNEKASV